MSLPDDSLHRSTEAAKSLRLDLARMLGSYDGADLSPDDLQTLQDSFDGETMLDVEIRKAVLSIEEDEIFVIGCKDREAVLANRRLRLEKRIEATRGLIEQAMNTAKWPTLEMDIGTVSLGRAAPRIEIDEESQIPSQFWKRQEPKLDKSGLGKVLRERQKGAEAIAQLKTPEERAAAFKKLDEEMPPIPGCHLETSGVSLIIRRA